MPIANAAYANTTVICATNGGNQQSFGIGWDNSNQFFANKGYIPKLFCEGGYAGNYRIYISDTLNGSALGYFAGVVPTPVEPVIVAPVDTSTGTSGNQDTQTATADTSTATSDTSTSSSDTTTTTSQQETPTVTPQPTDSSTTPSDTSTVETSTVDGSTATSEPGSPSPAPAPAPPPAVEPEPPAVAPEPPAVEPEPPAPVEEAPEEAPEPPAKAEEPPTPEPEEEPAPEVETTVTLDNGVVLTQEQAVAVALLQNPAELLQELFTNPGAALAALGQVGADMSPEVREQSKKVVISAVIAGNIATQAAATAGAVASYRRKS